MTKNLISNPICHLSLVIILCILGYSHTLNAPFYMDDHLTITQNPIIKNLDYYASPSKAKIYTHNSKYALFINRYVGSLTFALNYKVHGLGLAGYHVVNILIHLINSMLVYWLVNLIFNTIAPGKDGRPQFKHASTIALFTSLLFVSHPVQTQAITYIIQRFASLATMLYLLSIIMYIKFRLAIYNVDKKDYKNKISIRAIAYYLAALFAAVLAMKTKEIAFTLPTMIVLYEFLFFQGSIKSRILPLVPFILTMLIIPVTLIFIASLGKEGSAVTRLATDMPRLDYLFTEFRVIMTYLRLIFFPLNQNLDYDYPLSHSLFDPEVLIPFVFLLTICLAFTWSFWRFRKTLPLTRVIFFGAAWFFVTLSVESSIIPIVDVIFEHRMYLPSPGIFLIISVLLVMLIERYRQKWVRKAIFLSLIITSLVLTGMTYSRNNLWNDQIAFAQDVVSKSPGKERSHISLGDAYTSAGYASAKKGELDLAIKYFNKAIAADPLDYLPYLELGIILKKRGRLHEALAAFEKALHRNPLNAVAHNNLGMCLGTLGQTDKAIKEFKEALRISPSNADIHYNLSIAYRAKGLINDARTEMQQAKRLQKMQQ